MSEFIGPVPTLTVQEEMALQQFVLELEKRFVDEISQIILYGSKARGDALAHSDIDLLIVMLSDSWAVRNQISQIASRVSLQFNLLLSSHVVSVETWQEMTKAPLSFYKNVFQEGIPLFQPEA